MKNSIRLALAAAAWAAIGTANTATFTVTNLNDSGAGSLRDAVAQANASLAPNTVDFAQGVAGSIVLTTGQINITGPLSIVGPGSSALTIDGNASNRIFTIGTTFPVCPAVDNGGVDYLVSISGLRLINGVRSNSNVGGAIYTEHSLALDSVNIENSFAALGGGLGFMVQYANQTLTINNTLFINNIAKPLGSLPSSTHHGGAVYVSEKCASMPTTAPVTVNINASNFTNNRIQPVGLNARGGAISVISRADVTISNSRIVGNGVDAPNPLVADKSYRAGALYGYGNKSVTIRSSEISDNMATSSVMNNQTRAGAIGLAHDDASLQTPSTAMAFKVFDSTISGNTTTDMAGAIWLYGNIAFELFNSTISNNVAANNSVGGIVFQTGTTTPISSSNAAAPTFSATSSIIANSSAETVDIGINDLSTG